jgi:hypothetical protein
MIPPYTFVVQATEENRINTVRVFVDDVKTDD